MNAEGGAYSERELSLLERNSYLEEANRQYVSILDTLATSGEFQNDLGRAGSEREVYEATLFQIRRLLPLQAVGCLECADEGSFNLVACDPPDSRALLKTLFEGTIMDGSFAWALNRNAWRAGGYKVQQLPAWQWLSEHASRHPAFRERPALPAN